MIKLKDKMIDIYKLHINGIDKIKAEYEPYFNESVYHIDFVANKKAEMNQRLLEQQAKSIRFLDEALNVRLSQLEPNKKVIDSLEYQTKLSNILNMLNMTKGKIDVKSLDFIAEARDMQTLKVIETTYENNDEILNWTISNDLSYNISRMTKMTESMKHNMNPKSDTQWLREGVLLTLENIQE